MAEATPQTRPPLSRFNVAAFVIDIVTYYTGTTLLSAVTILPLFASEMAGKLPQPQGTGAWLWILTQISKPAVVVALIPTLFSLGILLPQILGARLVTGREVYRPMVIRLGTLERTWVFAAVVSMWLLANSSPALLLIVPVGFLFLWMCTMGLNHPGYAAMLEHTIPAEMRGRMFGYGAAMGGVGGFAAALAAKWFLQNMAFPFGFVACGALAWVILTAGFIPLAFVRETPSPQPTDEEGSMHSRLVSLLRGDRPYWRYLLSQILFAFQLMPTAVWTTYALKRFQATPGDIAVLTAVMALAGGVGFLMMGPLADRYGNRAVLLWSTLFTGATTLAAWGAPSLFWYIAVFVPASIANSGWQLTGFNIVMEFSPRGRVHTYTAANAAVPGPFRVLAPMLGGVLVAQLGRHGPVFAAAGIAALASAFVLLFVAEPRLNSRQR